MLEIVNFNEDSYEFPCLLVLGCFDGLHIGHAELLKKAKLQAKINGLDLGVMMFAEGKGGKQVFTFEERLKFLEQYNVKFVLKADFNNEFKSLKPLDFLAVLEDKLNVKAYMSGKDFRFGAGAKGKSSLLKNYAEDEENGVWYMSVKDVTCGDDKVSTTLVKTLIANGDLARANELLGRNFSLTATSANFADGALTLAYPDSKVQIPSGEYTVKCTVGETAYAGIANYQGGDTLCVRLEGLAEYNGEEVTVEFTSSEEAVQSAPAEASVVNEKPAEAPVATEQPAEEPAQEQTIEAAVEEFAVTEETVEEAPAEEPVVEKQAEEELAVTDEQPEDVKFEENSIEEAEFEDELNEDFEEQPADETYVETAEETIEEEQPADENYVENLEYVEAQPAKETCEEHIAEEPVEEEQPTDETYVEYAEETEEQTEAPVEEPSVEEVEEIADELSYEQTEEIMEEILTEELSEDTEQTQELTDTEDNGDNNVD